MRWHCRRKKLHCRLVKHRARPTCQRRLDIQNRPRGKAALWPENRRVLAKRQSGLFQLDKNHDLVMDKSFNGPDGTSQASPMEWWVNNDHDWSSGSGDGYVGHDLMVGPNSPWNGFVDHSIVDYQGQYIECHRDLEDFARLWICGLPALTNAGYQVTLSWNVSSGAPAVNLVNSVETNGGTGYLTDTNVAKAQVDPTVYGYPGYKFAHVSPSQPYTFPANYFTNNATKHLLFEGSGIGSGELVLTIYRNSNVIAQTGAWLDLHDVKDFYERAVITNNVSGTISNWTSGIEVVQQATASALGDDTNLIVMVHGINVGDWDWQSQSDTVFKRLYWAGYRGKFATVKWPCEFFNLWTLLNTDTSVFNRSEVTAYKSGAALKTYIDQLHARFPGYRLHLFVHSQGNAVVSTAIQKGAAFDTYILTQGALPDSAYDVYAPVDSTLIAAESLYGTPEWQPMGYHGIYTNFTGQIVNFYNPNDPVLACWVADQAAGKPDGYAKHATTPLASYYTYDGANGWENGIFFGVFSSYLVTDPQESRAYISRSLTDSIGQSGPASAHGVIQSAVNLNANFGFNKAFPGDHSAQWVWPIQTCLPYYNQILVQIKPLQ